jgi:hypothetical protein
MRRPMPPLAPVTSAIRFSKLVISGRVHHEQRARRVRRRRGSRADGFGMAL